MCGIVGALAEFPGQTEHRNVFTQLLMTSPLRGMDSTGIFATRKHIAKKNRIHLNTSHFKEVGDAVAFFDNYKAINKVLSDNPILYCGHVRAATVGEVSKDNAHPFSFAKVIGVHNGNVDMDFTGRKEYDTDSEGFYALIDKVGIDQALKDVERIGTPKYALAWLDRSNQTFNIIRNSERPLYIAFNEFKTAAYFASEPGHLVWILSRNGIRICQDEGFKPFQPASHELITWNLSERSFVDQFKRRVIDVKPPVTTYNYPAGTRKWNHQKNAFEDIPTVVPPNSGKNVPWIQESNRKHLESTASACDIPADKHLKTMEQERAESLAKAAKAAVTTKMDDLNIHEFMPVFMGRMVHHAEYSDIMDEGCAFCGEVPPLTADHNAFKWYEDNQFVCDDCMSKPDVKSMVAYDPSPIVFKH